MIYLLQKWLRRMRMNACLVMGTGILKGMISYAPYTTLQAGHFLLQALLFELQSSGYFSGISSGVYPKGEHVNYF